MYVRERYVHVILFCSRQHWLPITQHNAPKPALPRPISLATRTDMLFNVLDWMCGSEKDNIVIFVTLIVKMKSHLCAQSIYEGQVLHNNEREATGIAPSFLHHHCQQRLTSNQPFANHLFVNITARDIILRRNKTWLIKLRTCRSS